jgi:predicted secreted Zn-dependent protease
MRTRRLVLIAVAVSCLMSASAWAQLDPAAEKRAQAYIDMMRKDLRAQKQSYVDQAVALEADQKVVFWGIYDKYQKELNVIWDSRLANIKKYADSYEKMTDELADEIAVKALDIEGQRNALKKKYYGEVKAKLGPRVAARFLQAETAFGQMIDLQMAAEIPLMK